MPSYTFHFNRKEEIAKGTMAFYFSMPIEFQFKAGQFVNLTIENLTNADAEGNSRGFTVASAPYESEVMIATRMRNSSFKQALLTMPADSPVQVRGPFGTMTLHRDPEKPAVFLTGGIGITPFRSIALQASREKMLHRLFLFYSNRHPEDAPFLQELQLLQKENKNYALIATMTDLNENQPWQGERGYINKEMLLKYLKNLTGPIYYIAGPPGLVTNMTNLLKSEGIGNEQIRAEEFSGY